MNHLVSLDGRAGELEKILSGVKTMLIKEFDPDRAVKQSVNFSDSLYYLRDQDERTVRVKAAVVRVLFFTNHPEDLSHTLKEMQPRLQLTEPQYNYWSAERQILLVEFGSAQKIAPVRVASSKPIDRSDWIAFEEFSSMTEYDEANPAH